MFEIVSEFINILMKCVILLLLRKTEHVLLCKTEHVLSGAFSTNARVLMLVL